MAPARGYLDAEALPTATFAGNIGIAEAKCFIEAFFDKIDLSSIDQGQAGLIHNNRHTAIFENPIFVISCYADVPEETQWDVAFSLSNPGLHESTAATLRFGIVWQRAVRRSLSDGWHQMRLHKALMRKQHCTNRQIIPMPAFKEFLTDQELDILVDYVLALRKKGSLTSEDFKND